MVVARAWGFWTRYKLDLLREYLNAFTTASKRGGALVYLDLFGGEPENQERHTGTPIDGSARIALSTDAPPFTHLRFFELASNARKLEAAIAREFPNRNTRVYVGDCNTTIVEALRDLHSDDVAWAPTFAFIDPNGPHFTWALLTRLARHKPSRTKTKVELWILFPDPLFARLLPARGDRRIRPEDDTAISEMFGTSDWHAIYDAKLREEITPTEAREEYVDLMRWRLQEQLGYRWTHQLEIRTETVPIYHMIFATDSEPGHKIMTSLYNRAAAEFPQMVQQARRRKRQREREAAGHFDLFGDEIIDPAPVRSGEALYFHEPPTRPRAHDAADCPHCA